MRTTPLFFALVLATACKTPAGSAPPQPAPASDPAPVPSSPKPMPPGLDESAMDPKVDPCDDFFRYACGGWLDRTEIPSDRERTSRGFDAIADRNDLILKQILEDAAQGKLPDTTPYRAALGDFYASCVDEAALEKALPSLQAQLKVVEKVNNARSLAQVTAGWSQKGLGPWFAFSSAQDFKNATLVIGEVDQPSLGLPDRDFYLEDSKKSVRDLYLAHVQRMFELLGKRSDAARTAAQDVVALETRLAKASQSRIERRNPDAVYHRLERAGLKKLAPAFDWDTYFKALGTGSVQAINVVSPGYFEELNRVVREGRADLWRTFLTWSLVRGSVVALPKALQEESFQFRSRAFTGAKTDRPRWKKCVDRTVEAMGEAVGAAFVAQTFGADGKERTLGMVRALEASFADNLNKLDWLDEATRAAALRKVQKIDNKIGYPDKWRDYSALKVERGSFLANLGAAAEFETRRRLNQIGKPLDRADWLMPPSTVNAYYEALRNEIAFPAGILQPPFFDRQATDAVNFGAMGMVVGHEITHGFDDEGSKFDADGNRADWWSPAVRAKFDAKTACVRSQFDEFVAVDDLHVKGDLTLGENVADLGGLKVSFQAMERWAAEHRQPEEAYRFDRSQQFFLGYAQSWCLKMRPEQARLRVTTDPHAPAQFRVKGPLGNLTHFKAAFHCADGARMVRPADRRCEVW